MRRQVLYRTAQVKACAHVHRQHHQAVRFQFPMLKVWYNVQHAWITMSEACMHSHHHTSKLARAMLSFECKQDLKAIAQLTTWWQGVPKHEYRVNGHTQKLNHDSAQSSSICWACMLLGAVETWVSRPEWGLQRHHTRCQTPEASAKGPCQEGCQPGIWSREEEGEEPAWQPQSRRKGWRSWS